MSPVKSVPAKVERWRVLADNPLEAGTRSRPFFMGEPSCYPCQWPYQAFAGGIIHDITAQADRSGYIQEIRHGAGFRRWKWAGARRSCVRSADGETISPGIADQDSPV